MSTRAARVLHLICHLRTTQALGTWERIALAQRGGCWHFERQTSGRASYGHADWKAVIADAMGHRRAAVALRSHIPAMYDFNFTVYK